MIEAPTIPSMTSQIVLDYLHELGQGWTGTGVAVECGCWLGASCAALAGGLVEAGYDRPIYCFDNWTALGRQVGKAKRYGVELEYRQDTEPLFRDNVSPIYDNLVTRRGPVETAEWDGGPIEFFLLDAAKSNPTFIRTLRIFGPSWIAGRTVVGLLDYDYWREFDDARRQRFRCQRRFIEHWQDHFVPLRDFPDRAPTFFRYGNGIDWRAVA